MTLTEYPKLEQRSDEWHAQRRGMVTASALGQLITPALPDPLDYTCACGAEVGGPCLSLAATKTPKPLKNPHAARIPAGTPEVLTVANNDTSRALIAVLVAERITGWTEDNWISSDMWRGIEHEPFALEAYTERTGSVVESCGFMTLEEDGWTIGYSPDALVDDDGLVEVKCPRAKGHLLTIVNDAVPAYHMAQLQAGLLVSGREWVDFVSFCAGMPLFIKRVTPSPEWHEALIAAATAFEITAAEMVATYTERTDGLPVTERLTFEIEV